MERKSILVIGGPTASGKTMAAIELAKRINGEIISADSVQVYKYMDIGSAKVTPCEMQGVKHYLIDELEPSQEFNIAVFKKKASEYIEKIYSVDKTPMIVGGTGFYVQSVLKDVDFAEMQVDYELREALESEAKIYGNEYVHAKLAEIDEASAKSIHPNNLKRVIRAIEYYKLTGELISRHNQDEKEKKDVYQTKYFVLNMDRELLYTRINKRVDLMVENGLIEEVEKLLEMGYNENLISMEAIGYKEVVAYLKGQVALEAAVEQIKQNTRNFAKRQLTWYKHQVKDAVWIYVDRLEFDIDRIVTLMINNLGENRKK